MGVGGGERVPLHTCTCMHAHTHVHDIIENSQDSPNGGWPFA